MEDFYKEYDPFTLHIYKKKHRNNNKKIIDLRRNSQKNWYIWERQACGKQLQEPRDLFSYWDECSAAEYSVLLMQKWYRDMCMELSYPTQERHTANKNCTTSEVLSSIQYLLYAWKKSSWKLYVLWIVLMRN